MATLRFFNSHRTWEDWLGIGIGVLIGLAPWMAGQTDSSIVVYNAAIVGILVLALAEFEMVDLRRWQEVAAMACGFWLIASPIMFGYASTGALSYWHFVLGATVVVLAAMELWQDWGLSDRELAHHGF